MFCDTLKALRMARNLNKKQVSVLLNMPYTTYNNYEIGAREPNSDVLIKISAEFGVTIDFLLGVSDDEDNVLSHPPDKTIKKYHLLNADGKEKVDNYIDDLLQNDKNIAATSHTTDTITPFDKFAMDMVKKAMINAKGERIKVNSIK